jgi:hypothetical protein
MKERLFILVEGIDDQNFFEKILIPKLKEKYLTIQIWQYANKKSLQIKKFVKSILYTVINIIFCHFEHSEKSC